MAEFIDLTNQKFGKLTVISRDLTRPGGRTKWFCQCDCGKTTSSLSCHLKGGLSKSCGCSRKESNTTHGHAKKKQQSSEYWIWSSMIKRCHNEKTKQYANYGGRGVRVCDRWRESFQHFIEDMGPKPENHSIERIDNNGDYCPENCKWATMSEQSRNKRMYSSNKSGTPGVYYVRNRWQVYLKVNKKQNYIGSYSDLESAIAARKKAEHVYLEAAK